MENISTGYFLVFILFAISLSPIIRDIFKKKFDIFNLRNLFIIYFLIQLGLYPLIIMFSDEMFFPWTNLHNVEDVFYFNISISLSIFGIISFLVGYYLKLGDVISVNLPRLPIIDKNKISIIAFIFAVIGLMFFLIFIGSRGGLVQHFESLGSWRGLELIGQGYLTFPISVILPTSIILLSLTNIPKDKVANRIFITLLFVLSLVPSLILGFRITIIPPILQFLAVWHYLYKPFSIKKISLVGICLFLTLSVYGITREVIEYKQTDAFFSFIKNMEVKEAVLVPVILRSKGTDMVSMIVKKIDQGEANHMLWGPFIYEALTIMVPRAIWPGKPMPSGFTFGELFMSDYLLFTRGSVGEGTGGFSTTAIGFFYWQMGALGVFVGMFLLGLFAKTMYKIFCKNKSKLAYLLLYLNIMSIFPIFTEAPQDALNGMIMRLSLTLLLLVILAKYTYSNRTSVISQ